MTAEPQAVPHAAIIAVLTGLLVILVMVGIATRGGGGDDTQDGWPAGCFDGPVADAQGNGMYPPGACPEGAPYAYQGDDTQDGDTQDGYTQDGWPAGCFDGPVADAQGNGMYPPGACPDGAPYAYQD